MRVNPSSFSGTNFVITEFPRPALRRVPNAPIQDFDESFATKAQEMMVVMYEADGVGLAAPQVGLNENFFVYNPTGDKEANNMERIVCNPIITKYSPEVDVEEEACLSMRSDEIAGDVARASWIQAEYQNELGQNIRRRLKGFEARVFQHEYDHLNGILCWDRFPPEDREAAQAKIDMLLGLYKEEDAQIEPDSEKAKEIQPPPLTAKSMPPLQSEAETSKKKKTPTKTKSGFGGSTGFGSGKKTSAKKKKKK